MLNRDHQSNLARLTSSSMAYSVARDPAGILRFIREPKPALLVSFLRAISNICGVGLINWGFWFILVERNRGSIQLAKRSSP